MQFLFILSCFAQFDFLNDVSGNQKNSQPNNNGQTSSQPSTGSPQGGQQMNGSQQGNQQMGNNGTTRNQQGSPPMNVTSSSANNTRTNLQINRNQQCNQIIRRPEIRELSPQQVQDFVSAIKQLHETNSYYDNYSNVHITNAQFSHSVPAFFPWHREYIRLFELELQKINPSIVLPYWDWTLDSQAPETSVVFSQDYFGGNGRNSDWCVASGPFQNWQMQYPTQHCLKRNYDGGDKISSLYSAELIEYIITNSTNYNDLRVAIETAPHGRVHTSIGGAQGDLTNMFSSNDPIFWLHHTFVDKIWYEWQQRNPNLANTYEGNLDGRQVTDSDNMVPFDIPVNYVYDTTAPGYCYSYSRFSAPIPSLTTLFAGGKNSTQLGNQTNIGDNLISNLNNGFGSFNQRFSSLDRSNTGVIRHPDPIPFDFLRRNNWNEAQVRDIESKMDNVITNFNGNPNFRPLF